MGQTQPPSASLYEWYNPATGRHFYTLDSYGELARKAGYIGQGLIGYVGIYKQPDTTALYRWYNPTTGDHFYTTDPNGEGAPSRGYISEGITGFIAPFNSYIPGTTSLYRWRNPTTGDHILTIDSFFELHAPPGYIDSLIIGGIWPPNRPLFRWTNYTTGDQFISIALGGNTLTSDYTLDGIIGFTAGDLTGPSLDPPLSNLNRWYNPTTGRHFYTTDPNGEGAPSRGYISEGITGLIATSQIPGTIPLYRWYSLFRREAYLYFYTTDPDGEGALDAGFFFENIIGYLWPSA